MFRELGAVMALEEHEKAIVQEIRFALTSKDDEIRRLKGIIKQRDAEIARLRNMATPSVGSFA